MDLKGMVRILLQECDVPRIRLSSLEPWGLPPGFLELWSDRRMCRHLHLPLQSGCDRTLRRMGRPITAAAFAQLVDRAREAIPGLAVSTDILVGFPGESEQDFLSSLAFARDMAFSGAHVFTYSPRHGTAAVRLREQVPPGVAKERSAAMRRMSSHASQLFRSSWIGAELEVLWESVTGVDASGWRMHGRTDNNLRVSSWCQERAWNRITRVKVTGLDDDGSLQGETLGLIEA
jgi:threonylcarbamoyladenosine tRNA methylthiotransferase MtaB